MVALVVQPYLGYLGLYMGEETPAVRACTAQTAGTRKTSRDETKRSWYQDAAHIVPSATDRLHNHSLLQSASMRQPPKTATLSRDRRDSFDMPHNKKHLTIIAYR